MKSKELEKFERKLIDLGFVPCDSLAHSCLYNIHVEWEKERLGVEHDVIKPMIEINLFDVYDYLDKIFSADVRKTLTAEDWNWYEKMRPKPLSDKDNNEMSF